MPVPNRKYRDFDLDFTPHPITKQLPVLTDGAAVRRSIRNLILTSFYERFYRPSIGSGVNNSLFMPANVITAQTIKKSIEDVISAYEPRAETVQIELDSRLDLNGYDVVVTFNIRNIPEPIELTMFLRRTR